SASVMQKVLPSVRPLANACCICSRAESGTPGALNSISSRVVRYWPGLGWTMPSASAATSAPEMVPSPSASASPPPHAASRMAATSGRAWIGRMWKSPLSQRGAGHLARVLNQHAVAALPAIAMARAWSHIRTMAELVIRRGLEEPDTSTAFTPHKPQRPAKSLGGRQFRIVSDYEPAGDQPTAIGELVAAAHQGERTQVLLGVTGSGKTFTMAKVIEELQRPALVLAPNKNLAAQHYAEFKSFFPENAVEYFVSYYDYYQPEAYVPRSVTYIEKERSTNEAIDRMRHSATRALLERDDVIIVASVSCIYGIGSVETYTAMTFQMQVGDRLDQRQLLADLVEQQYKRRDADFARGSFRVR